MKYNFDEAVERRGTGCLKYDFAKERGKKEDVLPLWVADMDFKTAPAVTERLQKVVEHGIYGYSDSKEDYFAAVSGWYHDHFDWDVKPEWLVKTPGVVFALAAAVRAYTEKGDTVLIQQPVYYPFRQVIESNDRKLVSSDLVLKDGHYEIDFEDFEAKIKEHQIHLFLLCSPHNPVGRVWTKEELEAVGEFCIKHELLLFVDEIHGDITAPGVEFVSALSLSEEVRKRLIVASSPTKTFNIPGFILSYLIIPNQEYRVVVKREIDRIGMHNPTIFSAAVAGCAYQQCDDWYKAMLSYIDENDKFTRAYFAEKMPEFYIYPREGTYLLWMDYKELGCEEAELEKWFLEKAKVSVYMGTVFQEEGRGCIRLNIASPRKLLEEAYDRMYVAYCHIKKN